MRSDTGYAANRDSLHAAVASSGTDAVVLATPENVRYAGGLAISTQRNIRHRPAFVFWPANREPVFVVVESELARIRRGSWIEQTACYREFGTSPMEALAAAVSGQGLAQAVIGCELEYMPAALVDELRQRLPQARIVGCDQTLRRVRMLKSPEEIEILACAGQATSQAIERTFAAARLGDDEYRLHRSLCDELMSSGAERIHSAHIYGGAHAVGPHMGPSSRSLQAGDLVKADLCGVFDSYISNVGRTAVVGAPSTEDVRAWAALYDIHRRLMELLRPGSTGQALYRAAQELYARAEFTLRHPNNGHCIGLEVHERPQLGPNEEVAYQPGMVTTVETRKNQPGSSTTGPEALREPSRPTAMP